MLSLYEWSNCALAKVPLEALQAGISDQVQLFPSVEITPREVYSYSDISWASSIFVHKKIPKPMLEIELNWVRFSRRNIKPIYRPFGVNNAVIIRKFFDVRNWGNFNLVRNIPRNSRSSVLNRYFHIDDSLLTGTKFYNDARLTNVYLWSELLLSRFVASESKSSSLVGLKKGEEKCHEANTCENGNPYSPVSHSSLSQEIAQFDGYWIKWIYSVFIGLVFFAACLSLLAIYIARNYGRKPPVQAIALFPIFTGLFIVMITIFVT